MGRGKGTTTTEEVGPRSQTATDVSAILYSSGTSQQVTRSLKRKGFFETQEEWKQKEKEYIDSVLTELETATQNFAASNSNWRDYLRVYAQSPTYSATNNIWARIQLAHKGAPSGGLVLSESAWKALGRRPKEEHARPDRRRDKRNGFDYDREWDDSYAVEMMQPLGHRGFMKPLEDANGNPVLDKDGEQKKVFIPVAPKGFKSFIAYHEDATEGVKGGEPPPLPGAPWSQATGSDEDAQQLLDALTTRVVEGEGFKITFKPQGQSAKSADFSVAEQTIQVNSDAPLAEQASAALRELFVGMANRRQANSDSARQRQQAAIESAKYVVASLYNLDSEEQTFPHLAEIAEEKNGLRRLGSEIHGYVGNVLSYLDPVIQAQVRQRSEYKPRSSRAKSAKRS